MEEEQERKEYNLRHGIEEEKPLSPKKKKTSGVIDLQAKDKQKKLSLKKYLYNIL